MGNENFWTDDAIRNRMAISNKLLGIYTESYGFVRMEVSLLKGKPHNSFKNYDHVVEASLEIDSGGFQIFDCTTTDIQLSKKISNGIYRVRVYHSNLTSVKNESGNDHYKIELWPENNLKPLEVLKEYKSI